MLQNPNYAISSMEDGLVDVIVMNLILKKAYEDSRRKRYETAPMDFSAPATSESGDAYWCSPRDYSWSFEFDSQT